MGLGSSFATLKCVYRKKKESEKRKIHTKCVSYNMLVAVRVCVYVWACVC